MDRRLTPWFLTRLMLLILFVWGGFEGEEDTATLTWSVVWLFSLVLALPVVACMASSTNDTRVDWSDSYSLTKPFFPITLYPIRFWLFISAIGLSTGIASSAHDLFAHGSINPGSGMYLLSGTSILVSLLPWLLRHAASETK